MAKKTLSVITKQTGTPLEIAVVSRRLSSPTLIQPDYQFDPSDMYAIFIPGASFGEYFYWDSNNRLQIGPTLASSSDNLVFGRSVGTLNTTAGNRHNIIIGNNILAAEPALGSIANNVIIGGQNTCHDASTVVNSIIIGSFCAPLVPFSTDDVLIGTDVFKSYNGISSWNTAIGVGAIKNFTSGINNTAYGFGALLGATSAGNTYGNTAVGVLAMQLMINSSNNVALGHGAGNGWGVDASPNVFADKSIYIGAWARPLNTHSYNEIVIASDEGEGDTKAIGKGSYTTKIGTSDTSATYLYGDLYVNDVLFTGSGSGDLTEASLGTRFKWTAGLLDLSIGDYATDAEVAATYATNASVNTALGAYATNASVGLALTKYVPNTGGAFNGDVSITGANIITGLNGNVRLGGNSMAANSGSNNVAIGPNALGNLTMGNGNVAIGWNAGADAAWPHGTFTDGSNNVYIGTNSTPSNDSVVNEIALGMGSRGRGSNTVAIGNVNTIATYLEGSLYVDLELWERSYSRAYIDGSLTTISNSISGFASNASVNTALTAYATNASVNTALGAYATNASVNLALEAYSTALSELDDVSIVSISDDQILAYDASDAVWKNTDTISIDNLFITLNQDVSTTSRFQIDGSLIVGDYTSGNYTEIGSDGTLRQYGNATTFEDLVIPLTQAKLGTNLLPDFDYDELAYLFPNNDATEILYFVVQMPHKRKYGSKVYPHVHYRQKTNVKPVFKLDYKWFNIGASVPSAWKTYVMDASVVAWVDSSTHQLAVGADGVDGSTYGLSSMMLCKLYRQDASVAGDIAAWQFDIRYETDAFGSHELYSK